MAQKKKGKSAQKSKKKNTKITENTGVIAFVRALFGFLFGVLLLSDPQAPLSGWSRGVLLGLFGKTAPLFPIALICMGAYSAKTKKLGRAKLIYSLLSVCCISALAHLCTPGGIIQLSDSYSSASALLFSNSVGGGVLGALLACPLGFLLHRVGAFIIILGILLVLLSLTFGHSIFSAIAGGATGIFGAFRESAKEIDSRRDYENAYNRSKEKTKKLTQTYSMDGAELLAEARSFMDDNKDKKREEPKKKRTEEKKAPKQAEVKEQPEQYDDNGIDEVFSDIFGEEEKQVPSENTAAAEADEELIEEKIEEKPADINAHMEAASNGENKKREKKLTEEEQAAVAKEIDNSMTVEKREYIYPSCDLLNPVKSGGGDSRQQMYETSNKLISILENFNVKAKLLQVTQGPAVTRYEIQPSTGVKLSKIVGLADDLALNLAVPTVLVAAVPGKAAVGIEVPNRETSSVSARELLESEEFKKSKSKLTIALGRDIGGRVVIGDIAKMPHILIAGSTGSGKSVCINTIITSLLYKASPDEVKLIMVDPKVVELGVYNGIPHLLIPVVTDPKKAAGALNWAVSEMMRRYDVFAQNYVKNLEGYNHLMEKNGTDKLPQIVIIIDELADLMMVAAKEVEDYICRLAQLARAAGIHLIVATQRPTVDVITGLIKANIPSRIAFAVASQVDSRTIIDRGGADKLLGKGDMLYAPQGSRSPLRVQGAFVSDDEIERLLDFLKAQNEDAHYSEDLEEHIERVSSGENGVTPDEDDDGDEYLPQAIELAVELGQISTAMIQRKLKVGYSRAGRIIDQMEERGVIGPANGSKPRQVYISHADLEM